MSPPGAARGPPTSAPPGAARSGPSLGAKLDARKMEAKKKNPKIIFDPDDPDAPNARDHNDNDVDTLEAQAYKIARMEERMEEKFNSSSSYSNSLSLSNETMEGLSYVVGKQLRDVRVEVENTRKSVKRIEMALLRDARRNGDYNQVRSELIIRRNEARQRERIAIQDEKEERDEIRDDDKYDSYSDRASDIHARHRYECRRKIKNKEKVKWITKCISSIQSTGEQINRRKCRCCE